MNDKEKAMLHRIGSVGEALGCAIHYKKNFRWEFVRWESPDYENMQNVLIINPEYLTQEDKYPVLQQQFLREEGFLRFHPDMRPRDPGEFLTEMLYPNYSNPEAVRFHALSEEEMKLFHWRINVPMVLDVLRYICDESRFTISSTDDMDMLAAPCFNRNPWVMIRRRRNIFEVAERLAEKGVLRKWE